MSTIIAMSNSKGGVGKTTTTINLGANLARRGSRVLMVDLDPQRNLTLALRIIPSTQGSYSTIYDMMMSDQHLPPRQCCQRIDIVPGPLFMIAASEQLTALSLKLAKLDSRYDAMSLLSSILAPYQTVFDYILLDCPASIDALTGNALAAATHLIVPAIPSYLALIGTERMGRILRTIQEGINPGLKPLGIVIGKYRQTTAAQMIREKLNNVGGPQLRPFTTVIPDSVAVEESQIQKLPIGLYSARNKVSTAFEALTDEILTRLKGEEAPGFATTASTTKVVSQGAAQAGAQI